MKINLKKIIYIYIISFGFCLENLEIPQNTGARYVTTGDGILRMYVNVWGHINSPGRILVDEGVDIATLLSLAGGPEKGAKLNNIRIYREYPDNSGLASFTVDFTEFLKTGNRDGFIPIEPNDTIIIRQTAWSYFIDEIGTVNTIMSLINLYLNLSNMNN